MSLSVASYEKLYDLCRQTCAAPDDWRQAVLFGGVMRWFAEFRGFEACGSAWAAAGMARRAGIETGKLSAAGMDEETIRLVRQEKVPMPTRRRR